MITLMYFISPGTGVLTAERTHILIKDILAKSSHPLFCSYCLSYGSRRVEKNRTPWTRSTRELALVVDLILIRDSETVLQCNQEMHTSPSNSVEI